jgi:hypothetical protein
MVWHSVELQFAVTATGSELRLPPRFVSLAATRHIRTLSDVILKEAEQGVMELIMYMKEDVGIVFKWGRGHAVA